MRSDPLFVLAGGFGTRLRPVVADVPKPLAPVEGRPFLDYLIDSWLKSGTCEFVFLLHHHANQIENFLHAKFAETAFAECAWQSVVEPAPLGTGGSVANALSRSGHSGSFMVANADTWLPSGIQALHAAEAPAMAFVEVDDASRYGRLEVADAKVTRMREKSGSSGPGPISAGLYRLRPEHFLSWTGGWMSMETEILPKLIRDNALHAQKIDGRFIDIGIPDDYELFCRWARSGELI